jgi:hypothetical protein
MPGLNPPPLGGQLGDIKNTDGLEKSKNIGLNI